MLNKELQKALAKSSEIRKVNKGYIRSCDTQESKRYFSQKRYPDWKYDILYFDTIEKERDEEETLKIKG